MITKLSILVFWFFFIGPLVILITTLDGLGHGIKEWISGTIDIWKRG